MMKLAEPVETIKRKSISRSKSEDAIGSSESDLNYLIALRGIISN